MPTYEYVCRACGHEFEQFQPITAPSVKTCPKCKRKRVERKIGIGAGILFKGGGFYETDYRSDSYRKAEEAEKKESQPKADPTKSTPAAAGATDKPATASPDKPADKLPAKASAITTPKEPAKQQTAAPQEVKPKKSAREGRGAGNLKQPTKAKKTRRT